MMSQPHLTLEDLRCEPALFLSRLSPRHGARTPPVRFATLASTLPIEGRERRLSGSGARCHASSASTLPPLDGEGGMREAHDGWGARAQVGEKNARGRLKKRASSMSTGAR
jgi:hypothetical protein